MLLHVHAHVIHAIFSNVTIFSNISRACLYLVTHSLCREWISLYRNGLLRRRWVTLHNYLITSSTLFRWPLQAHQRTERPSLPWRPDPKLVCPVMSRFETRPWPKDPPQRHQVPECFFDKKGRGQAWGFRYSESVEQYGWAGKDLYRNTLLPLPWDLWE